MSKRTFGMKMETKISGNNTNPKVAIFIFYPHCNFPVDTERESVFLKMNGHYVSGDTNDLKFLRGDYIEIALTRMEMEIERLIIAHSDPDAAVKEVIEEFNIELQVLADRAGLEKIDYVKEFNF